MNIAIHQMYNRIGTIIYENEMDVDRQHYYLADIYWLTMFIQGKIEEYETKNATSVLIPNMAIAMEMDKLPNELELKNLDKVEPKEKAILIAQNLLFIAAQLDKFHNLQNAADNTLMDIPFMSAKDSRLNEMIKKKLLPQNVVQFFLQKYEVWIIAEKHELSKKMEQLKIEEMVESVKIAEHHSAAGGSSSANLVGNERKEDKKKGKATMGS